MIDHADVLTRPWLYPPHVVNLVEQVVHMTESLLIAQIAIDELREEVRLAHKYGYLSGHRQGFADAYADAFRDE